MRSQLIRVLVMCGCGLPAMAGTVLFSDLGTNGTIYTTNGGNVVDGSAAGLTPFLLQQRICLLFQALEAFP